MLKIALTGGIGSGKSTVAKIFRTLGVPIYIADEKAKYLMTHNVNLKNMIRKELGKDAYYMNGRLNRSYLSQTIFGNKEKLERLNALVHPAVQRDFEHWCTKQNTHYVIEESAIIFEIGAQNRFDKIILVVADKNLRIDRVMKRDDVTKEAVLERMKHQIDQSKKIKFADFIIENNGSSSLIGQVIQIHRTLINQKT